MRARILGCVTVLSLAGSAVAIAGDMNADEARRFVTGKLFNFTCFDGTRGAGRILHDGSVSGTIQLGGAGPVRYAALPANTLQVKGEAVCASIKGLFIEPCFDLQKTSAQSFRGAVNGMGFAYCEFTRRSPARVEMARAMSRPRHRAASSTEVKPAPAREARAEPASLALRPTTE